VSLVLGDVLRRHADVVPDKPALVYRDGDHREVVTYGQLDERANRFAHLLAAEGVERGDRVAVLMFNNPWWPVAFFGALKRGAVVVPVNARFRQDEVVSQLRACRPTALLIDADFTAMLDAIRADVPSLRLVADVDDPATWDERLAAQPATEPGFPVDEHDPHVIFYTSGTTGAPKGAVHSHRNYVLFSGQHTMSPRGTGEDDIGLCAFPFFHMSGWANSILFWKPRATVVLLRRAAPEEILAAIQDERCTQFYGIPEMLRSVVHFPHRKDYDLRSLEHLNSGTSAMSQEDVDAACEAFGVEGIRIHYGSSEAGSCTMLPAAESRRRPSSIGRASLDVDVRLVDPADGRDVTHERGTAGELVVRNDSLLLEYFENPEETARALRDGWYRTGDLATTDDDGFLYICGRIKEVIRSGGESIFPTELERTLLELAGVEEASVLGVPDPQWGEAALAVVVAAPGAALSAEAVIAHCGERLASYKKPRHVMFVDELPKAGATQKVQKALLRQWFEARTS
jgi:acyl-CoA synthetase (AMP-forming)/AMP-acid ligase II